MRVPEMNRAKAAVIVELAAIGYSEGLGSCDWRTECALMTEIVETWPSLKDEASHLPWGKWAEDAN